MTQRSGGFTLPDLLTKEIPPNDIPAERAVLGAMPVEPRGASA